MIVTCAQCGTQFRLDESQVGEKGVRVRCSQCANLFSVSRPAPSSPPPMPGASPLSLEIDLGPPAALAQENTVPQAQHTSAQPPKAPRETSDLEFVEADLLADIPELGSVPVGPDPNRVETVVGFVPNLRRNTQAPTAPAAPSPELAPPADLQDEPPPAAPVAAGSVSFPADDDLFGAPDDLSAGLPDDDPFAGHGLAADGRIVGGALSPSDAAHSEATSEIGAFLESELLAKYPEADKPAAPEPQATDEARPTQSGKHKRAAMASLRSLYSAATTLLVLAALLLGALLFVSNGRLDTAILRGDFTHVGSWGGRPAAPSYEGVVVTSMRSVLYPIATRTWALVFFGTVHNTAREPRVVDVVAELRNATGEVLARAQAPVGLKIEAPQLATLGNDASVLALYRDAVQKRAGRGYLAAGEEANYAVIVLRPPPANQLAELEHSVELVPGETWVRPPPPPPPVTPAQLELGKRKGKRLKRAKHRAKDGALAP